MRFVPVGPVLKLLRAIVYPISKTAGLSQQRCTPSQSAHGRLDLHHTAQLRYHASKLGDLALLFLNLRVQTLNRGERDSLHVDVRDALVVPPQTERRIEILCRGSERANGGISAFEIPGE